MLSSTDYHYCCTQCGDVVPITTNKLALDGYLIQLFNYQHH